MKRKKHALPAAALALVSLLAGTCLSQDASPQTRADRQMAGKVDTAFREAQSRRSSSLESRLTEIWQAIALSEPEIEKYAKENPRRHGAVIYVRATGESGAKSIRIIFHRKSETPLDGKLGKNIKEWFLPEIVAQSLAAKTLARLSQDPSAQFSPAPVQSGETIEIVLNPKGVPPPSGPLLGESLFQK